MQEKYAFLSPVRIFWLLFLGLGVFTIYCFIKPLVLSIDSAYGFLAYKGSLYFHSFNVLQDIPKNDIGKLNRIFMSWWSPGQWIFPGLLNYFFGIRLGIASISVTLISLICGFYGYYRVFIFFKFTPFISALSLLVIFSSATLYYCFIIYQGGEILEFAFFPWFILYVFRIREITVWNLLGIAFFFLLCFIAKTTLIVYCCLVLAAKLFQNGETPADSDRIFQFSVKKLILLLPAICMTILIYIFYLSPGPHPSLVNHFELSVEGILIPVSSPLTSLCSFQQWIERFTKMLGGSLMGNARSVLIYFGLYVFASLLLLWLLRLFIRSSKLIASYKCLFLTLYLGLMTFFVFAYSFNTNIDFSSRHFKLMGYLFVPGLLTILSTKINEFKVQWMIFIIFSLAIVDIFYLKEKWIKDRYIGAHYFYRNSEPLPFQDKLDYISYLKLLELDRRLATKTEPVVFFVESSADIAMDLHHPFILQRPQDDIRVNVYQKSGPELLVCISKSSFFQERNILKTKFPGYKKMENIAETTDYLFFLGK